MCSRGGVAWLIAFSVAAIPLVAAGGDTPKQMRLQWEAARGVALEESVGYLTGPDREPDGLAAALRGPIALHDAPGGKRIGSIVAGDPKVQPYFLVQGRERKPIGLELSETLGCYTRVLLVRGSRGAWVRIPQGWLKVPAGLEFVSWKKHFDSGPDGPEVNAYPYLGMKPLTLVLGPGGTQGIPRDGWKGDPFDPKGWVTSHDRFIQILWAKDGWALVVLSEKSTYCGSGSPSGQVGWLKIVSDEGHPLIHPVYGCC